MKPLLLHTRRARLKEKSEADEAPLFIFYEKNRHPLGQRRYVFSRQKSVL